MAVSELNEDTQDQIYDLLENPQSIYAYISFFLVFLVCI